jgi:hypothetical protein
MEKLPHELEQELTIIPEPIEWDTWAPTLTEDDIKARTLAFSNASNECVIKKEGCETVAIVSHQKQLRYKDGVHILPDALQTADNLVICCFNCHRWLHNNQEEAMALGYLSE